MNKAKLKLFAVNARRDLINKVTLRAKLFGIDAKHNLTIEKNGEQIIVNKVPYPLSKESAFLALKDQYTQGYEQLIEEAAYTWFNRIIAIRYMEVCDYLPERVNVLSSNTGKVEPDILLLYSSMELDVNNSLIRQLIEAGKPEDAYRKLFIAQCNALQPILPFMFEKIDDFTELLLPDFLLDSDSVINRLVKDDELTSSFQEVEVIGWLYQYYMSERKEQAGGLRNNSVSKDDLPVVTQLFTPRWIVEYMVQNSLGKLYNAIKPENHLVDKWEYFLKGKQAIPVPAITSIEQIKVFDPACGSGHILVYAFDVLYEIYLEAGYAESDIPKLILENNLYGLDIDKRSMQLASFALIMKAQEKNRRFLHRAKGLHLNVFEFVDATAVSDDALQLITIDNKELKIIRDTLRLFLSGKQFGSLLQVEFEADIYKQLIERINQLDYNSADFYKKMNIKELSHKLLPILKQAYLLAKRYEVVVTNPPYHNKYNHNLKEFMDIQYKDFKSDLYSGFIFRCMIMTVKNGFSALMTPYTWMFISTHEKLRRYVIENQSISSFIQLEYSAFTEATVPICTFVIQNQDNNPIGEYIRLEAFKGADLQPIKVREAVVNESVDYRYTFNSKYFDGISGSPIAFWVTKQVRQIFRENPILEELATPKQGMSTADNDRFVRLWHEVNYYKIGFNINDATEALSSRKKWFPYNKGGQFRKWFGNQESIINWENDGQELKLFPNSVIRNSNYFFKEGITWSDISSRYFGVRYVPKGFIFANSGSMLFASAEMISYLMCLLPSKVVKYLLDTFSKTMHFEVGHIKQIPVVVSDRYQGEISLLFEQNILLSRDDWNSSEISWDFEHHPFLNYVGRIAKLLDVYSEWILKTENRFSQLKSNEESLNRIFIDLYGLQDEITSEVPDEEVTVRKADQLRDTKSFLSYFIGCIMGRYSLDIDGLAYAGGVWDLSKYNRFMPNRNGLILITDDAYFENDLVYRLEEFLAVTFGEETVEENLQWIAESLKLKANESAVERIRRYFLDEFFKDHTQMYQNRPIYWLVDSGKEKGLRTLIYLHRYQPDTLATIRFEQLQEIQTKYRNEIDTLEMRLANPSLSAVEKRTFEKKKELFRKRIEELIEFDKVLAEYANAQITLDLDDGVKVNYGKLQKVLAKI